MQYFLSNKMRYILIIFLTFSAIVSASAQSVVSGKVVDEKGEGLPGVAILLKGTGTGTTTNLEGEYRLNIPQGQENPTLIFSFVGYLQEEVVVGNRSVIDIELTPDIKSLDEVIVVGYGTTTRKDITTAVSKIDPSKIPALPFLVVIKITPSAAATP